MEESQANYLDIIMTASTVIGTFLLWFSTKKSLNILNEQIKAQISSLRSQTISQEISAHREIFFEIARDETFLKLLAEGSDTTETKKGILSSILINHALGIYTNYKSKASGTEINDGFEDDLASLMSIKFIRDDWEQVKSYHQKDFRDYIDKLIEPKSKIVVVRPLQSPGVSPRPSVSKFSSLRAS